jgi:hypothetical protein
MITDECLSPWIARSTSTVTLAGSMTLHRRRQPCLMGRLFLLTRDRASEHSSRISVVTTCWSIVCGLNLHVPVYNPFFAVDAYWINQGAPNEDFWAHEVSQYHLPGGPRDGAAPSSQSMLLAHPHSTSPATNLDTRNTRKS